MTGLAMNSLAWLATLAAAPFALAQRWEFELDNPMLRPTKRR